MKNKLIVFEGIDGCGKSTHSEALVKRLEAKGHKAVWTREPGSPLLDGTPWAGLNLREFILSKKKVSPRALELLLQADRAEHTAKVKELLDEGYWVVSDRSFVSGLAYGIACDNPKHLLESVVEFAISVYPDKIFFLDIGVDVAKKRREDRGGKPTREEAKSDKFARSVRDQFVQMAMMDRDGFLRTHGGEDYWETNTDGSKTYCPSEGIPMVTVDGTQSKDKIVEIIDRELGIL